MALFGLTPKILTALAGLVPAFYFGKFLDDKETERMTTFRDKSALYGNRIKPGDPPSWP